MHMEAPEVPLESVQDEINEHAEHEAGEKPGEGKHSWTRWVALSTALVAALAALAALLAGHTETEAMDRKMDANDTWTYYEATSVKAHGIEETQVVLKALGKEPDAGLAADALKYKGEKKSLEAQANAFKKASEQYLGAHTSYGYAVTMFQVAIALAAISALTRRRRYWLLSLGLGGVGIAFALCGATSQTTIALPEEPENPQSAPAMATPAAETGGNAGG
jgi:hypothetical protein